MRMFFVFLFLMISLSNVYAADYYKIAREYSLYSEEQKKQFWIGVSSGVNKNTPYYVDKFTIVENVTPLNDGATFHYILLKEDYYNLESEERKKFLAYVMEQGIKKHCYSDEALFMRLVKAKIHAIYYTKEHEYYGDFYFIAGDSCR